MTLLDPKPHYAKIQKTWRDLGNLGELLKLPTSLSPACLRVKTKQWTIERRGARGTEPWGWRERTEGREGSEGKSKPLMSKTFFVKRGGLTLKYSGWR